MKTALLLLLAAASVHAQRNINITGDAEIKVQPDRVVLNLGVEVHSKSLTQARQENDRRVNAVIAMSKAAAILDKDIQTDFVQLGMEYEGDGITPRYYYSRKSIVLTLHDISKMEDVLSAAVDAGATHIHSVQFETTHLREFRDKARAMAVQAATEKARDMAAAAGLKVVGGPVSIHSTNYGGGSWYGAGWWGGGYRGQGIQNSVVNAGSDAGGPQGTIALGRISVTANVAMEFRIE